MFFDPADYLQGDPADASSEREAERLRREAEQRAAAAMLDIDDVVFLRYHDGEVADDCRPARRSRRRCDGCARTS